MIPKWFSCPEDWTWNFRLWVYVWVKVSTCGNHFNLFYFIGVHISSVNKKNSTGSRLRRINFQTTVNYPSTIISKEISQNIFVTRGAELSWGRDYCIRIVYFFWVSWPFFATCRNEIGTILVENKVFYPELYPKIRVLFEKILFLPAKPSPVHELAYARPIIYSDIPGHIINHATISLKNQN